MTLYDKIISIYPELTIADFSPISGTIRLTKRQRWSWRLHQVLESS